MLALGHAKAFHITVTSHGQTGDADIMPPARVHLTFGPVEAIMIDDPSYVKMGGSWHQFTLPGMSRINGLYEHALDKASHPTTNMTVIDLGMKVAGGESLHAYTFKHNDENVATTLYIDAKGLPARIETAEGTVILISDINGPISIVPPPT
jgi:hypothetical protein